MGSRKICEVLKSLRDWKEAVGSRRVERVGLSSGKEEEEGVRVGEKERIELAKFPSPLPDDGIFSSPVSFDTFLALLC